MIGSHNTRSSFDELLLRWLGAVCGKKVEEPEQKLQVMNQAIRAVLYDEGEMVDRITTSMPELSQTFGLDSHGHVAFSDIKSFNEKFQTLYKQNIESQIAENEAPGQKFLEQRRETYYRGG